MNWKEFKRLNVKNYLDYVKEIVEEENLDNYSRKRYITHRRFYLMYYLRQNTSMTLSEIGQLFKRDHASVLHGIRYHKLSEEINDHLYFKNIERIKNFLDQKENEIENEY